MVESNRFEEARSRFKERALEDVLRLDEPDRTFQEAQPLLEPAYRAINLYFDNETFRKTLPLEHRDTIDASIVELANATTDLVNTRESNIGNFPNQKDAFYRRFSSHVHNLNLYLTTPARLYWQEHEPSENSEAVKEVRNNAEEILKSLQKHETLANEKLSNMETYRSEVETAAQEAAKLAGVAANVDMAGYFMELVKPIKDSPIAPKPQHKWNFPYIRWYIKLPINRTVLWPALRDGIILTVLIFIIYKMYANHTTKLIDWWSWDIAFLGATSIAVIGYVSYIERTYKKWGQKQIAQKWLKFSKGYEGSARIWFGATLLAIIFIFGLSVVLFGDLHDRTDIKLETLIVKTIVLLGPAYLIRFCVRNYNAARHLAAVNTHRAKVALILSNFMAPIDTESGHLKKDVLVTAAQLLFDAGETGYITKRDGAGTSDNFTSNFPSNPGPPVSS